MATVRNFQIARKSSSGEGGQLLSGEFAFNTADDYLYIGDAAGTDNALLFYDVSAGMANDAHQFNGQLASHYLDGDNIVFDPAGNIVATDVQAAIEELDTEKLAIADIDDTPVDSETSAPISSNWAYDHIQSDSTDHDNRYYTETEVDNLLAALGTSAEWQDSVIDRVTTPPGGESTGDRYLVIATASGAFAGHEDDIAEYNGSGWDFTTPTTGTYVSVDDETSVLYYFGGSSWTTKSYEATTASTGLTKVGLDIRLDSTAAGDGLGFSAGALSVNVDDSSIETSGDTLQVKALGITNAMLAGSIADGKLAEDYLKVSEIDDTPVDAETSAPISSNWAYDHANGSDPHSVYRLESELNATTDGASGADGIGATAVGGGSATSVQGILEELDTDIGSLETTVGGLYVFKTIVPISGNNAVADAADDTLTFISTDSSITMVGGTDQFDIEVGNLDCGAWS